MSDKVFASISFSSFSRGSLHSFIWWMFPCLPNLADSFCLFLCVRSALTPCLHGVALWDRSPMGPSGAVSLISWDGCSRNGPCVSYVGYPLIFGSWLLLACLLVSPLAGWLPGSTPTTSCMLLYRFWQIKTKQHKNQNQNKQRKSPTITAKSTIEQRIIKMETEIEQ